jgi:DNA-binding transcriptional LysR family regulator
VASPPDKAVTGFEPRAAIRTEQASSAPALASEGLGVTLVPGNVVPVTYDGILLRPDPPVSRQLHLHQGAPDPITEAFVLAITNKTLEAPIHIQERLHIGSS